MGRIYPTWLFLAVLALLATAPKAEAELITLRLDGFISEIGYDNAGLLPGNGVAVGTSLSAFLTLNTEAIPLNPTDYISAGQVLGSLSLASGGLQITSQGIGGLALVSKRDSVLHLEFEDVGSNFGFFDMITMDLIASGQLPNMPLSTLVSTTFTGGSFQAGHFNLPPNAIDLTGSLGSVTRVPEPSTVLSMLVAAGTFLAGRRRISR
jgi:hypothetical protein